MDNALSWIEEHPWLAGAIGLGGLLILLWLLGFFSSSTSQTSSNNGLAAAYYNAEAAQTTAGTQLQMATEAYAAQTAQDQIQANGAEAIASTTAGMYTTIGQQNASTTTALGNDQLLASENSNNDALAASNTAAMYGYQTAQAGYQAANFQTVLNTIAPQELAAYGGNANFVGSALPGGGFNVNLGQVWNAQGLLNQGYTPAGVAQITGLPIGAIA